MISSIMTLILSYNGLKDTITCLESILQHNHVGSYLNIVVVDNGSIDGSPAKIRLRFPDVTVLELPNNLGWAGGNNVGIRYALKKNFDFILLLNNDTIVLPNMVQTLSRITQELPVCLLHPAIEYMDPTEGSQLDPLVPTSLAGKEKLFQNRKDIFELDFACGACLLIPEDVFQRVGLFDERFFLQLEDCDFYLRAHRAGIPSLCAPDARILHAESRDFGGRTTPIKTYYAVRNSLLLTEKHSHTFRGYCRIAKELYWTLTHIAEKYGLPFPIWIGSRDPFAIAARMGIRDYFFRRFGGLPPSRLRVFARPNLTQTRTK